MPSSANRVAALLADLGKTLNELGLRWYLFGAQAAIIHGAGRLTADVDVTLDLGRMSSSDLIKALSRRGFRAAIPDRSFIETTRVVPLVHRATSIPVDLVLAGPGLEDLFFQRARRIKLGRVMVNVASLEDLIVMKILSGRPKDLEDVETLLAIRRDDVSIRVVQATLRQAEKLLDQSDLSPVFRQLLTAVPKARQAKAPARSRMKGRAVRERRRK